MRGFEEIFLTMFVSMIDLTMTYVHSEAELLDDLNDHWTASHHKKERNQLIDVRLGPQISTCLAHTESFALCRTVKSWPSSADFVSRIFLGMFTLRPSQRK